MSDPATPVLRSDNRDPFTGEPTPMAAGDTPTVPPEDPTPYVEYVKDMLEAEEKRNSALETRCIAVVTTSGTLVTLLLALGAWVTRVQTAAIEQAALTLAFISALLFVLAAIVAIGGNYPFKVWAVSPKELPEQLWQRWETPGDRPAEKVTATRMDQWKSARALTKRKADLLAWAIAVQVAAVGVLVAALGVVLL